MENLFSVDGLRRFVRLQDAPEPFLQELVRLSEGCRNGRVCGEMEGGELFEEYWERGCQSRPPKHLVDILLELTYLDDEHSFLYLQGWQRVRKTMCILMPLANSPMMRLEIMCQLCEQATVRHVHIANQSMLVFTRNGCEVML